jgi:hypothetical protein
MYIVNLDFLYFKTIDDISFDKKHMILIKSLFEKEILNVSRNLKIDLYFGIKFLLNKCLC